MDLKMKNVFHLYMHCYKEKAKNATKGRGTEEDVSKTRNTVSKARVLIPPLPLLETI